MDAQKIDPHEVGQVIVQLQEEIKIIKLQLENLPGYATGKSIIKTNFYYRRGTSPSHAA